jgi:cobalt-zinc-cadmium efflux system outer membrane protein
MSIRHPFCVRASLVCFAALVSMATAANESQNSPLKPPAPLAERLNLAVVLEAARQHPDALAAARLVDAARADVLVANRSPALALSSAVSTVDAKNGQTLGSNLSPARLNKSLGIDGLWERGGKRALRTDKAQTMVQLAQAERQETLVVQQLAAQMAFYELLTAQLRLDVLNDLAQSARLLAKTADIRLKNGDMSAQEAARTRIEADRAHAEAQVAMLEYQQSSLAIGTWTGLRRPAVGWLVQVQWPPDTAWAGLAATDIDKGPWLEARSDVTAARLRVTAANQALALAQALRITDPNLGTSVENTPDGFGNTAKVMAFRIAIPLVNANRYDGEIARATAEAEASQNLLERTRQRAQIEMLHWLETGQSQAERLKIYEKEILPSALRVAEQTETAYRKGGLSLTELLDARRTLRAVQLDVLNARNAYAKAWTYWQRRMSDIAP